MNGKNRSLPFIFKFMKKLHKKIIHTIVTAAMILLMIPLINKAYFRSCGPAESSISWTVITSIVFLLSFITYASFVALIKKIFPEIRKLQQKYIYIIQYFIAVISTTIISIIIPFINELYFFERCKNSEFMIPAAIHNIMLISLLLIFYKKISK